MVPQYMVRMARPRPVRVHRTVVARQGKLSCAFGTQEAIAGRTCQHRPPPTSGAYVSTQDACVVSGAW